MNMNEVLGVLLGVAIVLLIILIPIGIIVWLLSLGGSLILSGVGSGSTVPIIAGVVLIVVALGGIRINIE